jgi:hypothetical protein
MKPVARKDKLTTSELPEETLVYDLESHKLHCLNRPSALVWRHCDGRHDLAALEALLARELGLSAEEAAAAARLALEQLGRRNLLQEAPAPAAGEERLTRRKALRKMAVAAAAAIPLVMSLKSPTVAWASEFREIGCRSNADCPDDQACTKTATGTHSSVIIGLCQPAGSCGQAGQPCTGTIGTQGSCCAGLTCQNSLFGNNCSA